MSAAHGLSHTPEFRVWWDIIKRCETETCASYKNYGGRGITVCSRWRSSFLDFYTDMGPRPSSEYSIDRIDNNGPYCRGNCKWSTRAERNRNRRVNVMVEYKGVRTVLADACMDAGISTAAVRARMRNGWPESDLFLPSDRHRAKRHISSRKPISERIWAEYGGRKRLLKEICREVGVGYMTVVERRRRGWPESKWFIPAIV